MSADGGEHDVWDAARTILESVTDAVFLLDRAFRFAYLNSTAQRLLGRADLVGKDIWEEFPAARGTKFQEAYERAMFEGTRVDFHEHYPAPLDRWYEVRAFPAAEGVAVYFHDVTERLQAEEALSRSRAQLELVVRGADVGVWYCPLPFADLIWDDKVKEHFHLPPDAHVTIERFYERLHPEDRERTRAEIARSVEERRPYDIEYRTVSTDGEHVKWIRAMGRAFYGEDGGPRRFDGITLDVSRQKVAELRERTEQERFARERERVLDAERAARAEAERQSRMKDDFLATLSHELRTPLNAILGWSQLLRAGDRAQADLSRGLEVIERNARAQALIVDDLLDMSRMLSGKVRLELQRVRLRPLLQAALENAQPTADARAVTLHPLDGDADPAVLGDPDRLQQVLWNLLSNALKFTPRGGHVEISLARVGSDAEVKVVDDGEGIAAEFLPHVFERFRQADPGMSRRHGGLGLGLSIVKQVVELHGGWVSAESRGPGLGSTFTMRLPLATEHETGADGRGRA